MARRPSILAALKWDFVLIGLIAFAVLAYTMLQEPGFEPATSETTHGSRPPDRVEGDVLLLLPDTPAAEATRLDDLDCSYGWFNALWQHYGSFATALTRNLSPEMLAGRRVVIVPRRVSENLPPNGISALAGFARDGGQVVVELPGPGWQLLTGISPSTKLRQARTVTSVEGLQVHGSMRKHLPDTPLSGRLMGAPAMEAFPAGPVLIEVDGQPGLTVHDLGAGKVYTALFDFGCSVTGMQQGRPADQMRFGRKDDPAPLIAVDQRVAHERLLTSHVPYADLLERALFHRLSDVRPMPRLWSYPGTFAGALMLTHPTPQNVRATLGYADWARKREAASTAFVAPDVLSRSEAAILAETGAEVGLLWVRGVDRPPAAEPVGIGALTLYEQELSLDAQRAALSVLLPGDQPLRLARVESSLWDRGWDETFSQLAAAGLRLDNSFGPTDAEHYGYLFGTGFPYYPIDRRGLPLPLLELPFVMQGPNVAVDRLERMLGNSQAYFHQPLVVSLPSYAMRREPAPGVLLAFRDAFDLASEHNHWLTTIGEFQSFLSSRRNSVLTSQWSAGERRLTISVNLLGARVPSIEGGAFAGIAFPRAFDGQEIERVVLDGDDVRLRDLVTSGSSFERILEVGPGRHTISVFYAAPPVPEDGEDGEATRE